MPNIQSYIGVFYVMCNLMTFANSQVLNLSGNSHSFNRAFSVSSLYRRSRQWRPYLDSANACRMIWAFGVCTQHKDSFLALHLGIIWSCLISRKCFWFLVYKLLIFYQILKTLPWKTLRDFSFILLFNILYFAKERHWIGIFHLFNFFQ